MSKTYEVTIFNRSNDRRVIAVRALNHSAAIEGALSLYTRGEWRLGWWESGPRVNARYAY